MPKNSRKDRILTRLLTVIIFCLLICSMTVLSIQAAPLDAGRMTGSQNNTEKNASGKSGQYELVYDDQAKLLNSAQEQEIRAAMKPILEYGNVAFVTIKENSTSTERYANRKLHELFGYESAVIFLIDMDNREIFIFADGEIYSSVTSTKAEIITDNVYEYASKRDYAGCAKEAFTEILMVAQGQKIAEPMKYISNALLALISALILNFVIVNFATRLSTPTTKEKEQNSRQIFTATPAVSQKTSTTRTRHVSSSGGSYGGGGGHSGGGFSGGGHSGGGFSSGGGGGHRF